MGHGGNAEQRQRMNEKAMTLSIFISLCDAYKRSPFRGTLTMMESDRLQLKHLHKVEKAKKLEAVTTKTS